MSRVVLYLNYIYKDDILLLSLHGYRYSEIIEKSRFGYKGFINSTRGYIPLSHSINYEYDIVLVDKFIEKYMIKENMKISDYIDKLIERYKDSEILIITEREELKEIFDKYDIDNIISKDVGFNIGFDITDKLLKISKLRYLNGIRDEDSDLEFDTSKYFKPELDKHPFINFKQIMSITNEHIPGKYSILKYDSENEIGRKLYSAGYGLCRLKDSIDEIEYFIDRLRERYGSEHKLVTVNIKELYNSDNLFYFKKYFDKAISVDDDRKTYRLNLLGDREKILAMNIYPVGLGYSAMDKIEEMNGILSSYEDKVESSYLSFYDITDLIYFKNKKDKTEFKKELTNNDSVIFKYENERVKSHKIKLKLNIDLLERNSLNRLSKYDPKVTLAIVNHNDIKLEYYTIFDLSSGDKMIWCSFYTNVIYLKKRDKK